MRAAVGVLPELLRVQLWVVPSLAALIAALAALLLIFIDRHFNAFGLPLEISTESARAVLTSISGAMISFTALVFSVTMLVLQMASTQLSPRVARSFLRDRFNQAVLGLFVATFVFSLLLLASINRDTVPQLGVLGAILLVLAAVLGFVAYLDHMAHAIRPTSVMDSITAETREVIDARYPAADEDADPSIATDEPGPGEPLVRARVGRGNDTVVAWSHGSGYVQAIADDALLGFAAREGYDVAMEVGIGHFLAPGMALLRVADGRARSIVADSAGLDGAIRLGAERTMSQDPEFGFRQLVDVALRALSPSLNDPTTATQVIDRLFELLRHLQTRVIEAPRIVTGDDDRSISIPAPDWEAFLDLSVAQIITACQPLPSVMAHLRKALGELREAVGPRHAAAISRVLVELGPLAEEGGRKS